MPALKWTGTGILSLLGVKTGGKLPSWQDQPQLIPVLPALDAILNDPTVVEYLFATATLAGGSVANVSFATGIVPNGQIWVAQSLQLQCGAIATGAQSVSLGYQPNPNVGAQIVFRGPLITPSPGLCAYSEAWYPPDGFLWIPPGAQFFILPQVNTVVAATAYTLGIRFVRLSL